MKNNTILILGGNGFIGTHLTDALLKRGYLLKIFDRPNKSLLDSKSTNVEIIEGDLANEADVLSALENTDICFHLISTVLPKSSNQEPIYDIETNLISTVKFLKNAVRTNLKKIIFLSSGGTVYGLPEYLPIDEAHATYPRCSYGINKLAIEKYLHLFNTLYGLDYQVLRLSNPFGKGQRIQSAQGVVNTFLTKAMKGETVEIWGDGSIIRDYIYISDAINALVKSIDYNGPLKTLNIGSGQGLSLNTILDEMEEVLDRKIYRNYRPSRILDVPTNVLSIKNACQELKWKPKLTFREGLIQLL